ncbi:MAG: tetratricopeptide repeat protein [Armatimonadetes bacterium]|nr:tetratricopeptide repeat protein [Armatimonadota bacterium]
MGGLALHPWDGGAVVHPTRRTAGLVARLAYPDRPRISREELADLLYPDLDRDEGRTHLRQVLLRLRRILEPAGIAPGSVLKTGRDHVGLNPTAVITDVAQFDAAMDAAAGLEGEAAVHALARAAALYTGELLPDLDGDWFAVERRRLRERVIEALRNLAVAAEATRDYAAAGEHAARAIAIDPLNQTAHITVIRCAARRGDHAAARRRLAAMAKLWREEMGSEPPDEAIEAADAPTRRRPPLDGPVPAPMGRFFGRSAELGRIAALLAPGEERVRLLTLTGPGGSGKTRLAIEAVTRLGAAYEGAVRFVPLADLPGPGGVASAVGRTLGLPAGSVAGLSVALSKGCSDGAGCLLVLDNLEHVADDAARMLARLLPSCRGLTVLATSRRPVGLAGERVLRVAPLESPAGAAVAEQAVRFAGVQMLADRIQAHRPDFEVTDRNARAVADLCARLDGLPLAIEIVAGWSGVYTPEEILARVESLPALLADPSAAAPARVASLQSATDWSLRLLDEDERRLFAELSVFRGGWRAEAAAGVCGASPHALRALHNHSLITSVETRGRMRFGMLETLRTHAASLLEPEAADGLRGRHALWFAEMAERVVVQASADTVEGWPTALEPDLANCAAALQWCLLEPGRSAEDTASGVRLAAGLWPYWGSVGRREEARKWLTAARLAGAGSRTAAYAAALQGLGLNLGTDRGQPDAAACGRESLAIYRELGDGQGELQALSSLGVIHHHQGDHHAARLTFEEALAAARASGADEVALAALLGLALGAEEEGRPAEAAEAQRRALDIARRLGNKRYMAHLLHDLGLLCWRSGDLEGARAKLEESLTYCRDLSDTYREARCLWALGAIARDGGLPDEARRRALAMLGLVRAGGHTIVYASCLEAMAQVADDDGETESAAALLCHAAKLREGPYLLPRSAVEMQGPAALAAKLQADLDPEAYELAACRGRGMTSEEALELAAQASGVA